MSSIVMKSSVLSSRTARPTVARPQAPRVVCRAGTSGFESAGKDIKKAANKAGDQLSDNLDKAQRKTGNAADDAGAEAKSAGRDVKSAVSKGVDNVKDGLQNAGDKIADTASAVGDKAKDLIDGGKKNIDKAVN